MSRDELIRRAMLHATPRVARPGMFVGGKPGESAEAQAEANRNFGAASTPGAGGGGNDFRASPVGGLGSDRSGAGEGPSGTSPANREAVEREMRSAVNTAARMNALQSPQGMSARLGDLPNAAMAQAGVNPAVARQATNTMNAAVDRAVMDAIRAGSGLNQQTQNMQNVRAPDMMSIAEATNVPNPLLDPKRFSFANYGVMSGMQPETLAKLVAMQEIYGKRLGIGPHSGFRTPEMNEEVGGATHSQHLTGSAIDVTGEIRNAADTAAMINAASKAGFGGVAAYNTPGLVHMDIANQRVWGPSYSVNSVGSLPPAVRNALLAHARSTQPTASVIANPAEDASVYTGPLPRPRPENLVPAVASRTAPPNVYEAAANPIANAYVNQAQANAIAAAKAAGIKSYGYNLPGFENQATVTTASTQPNALGQQIAGIQKTLEAYNKLTPAQKAEWRAANPGVIDKLAADLQTLEKKYQGTYTTTGTLPEGYQVMGSGPYNVPAPGMLGGYTNYKNVTFGLPKGVKTTETVTATNPMARVAAPGYGADVAPVVAAGPQNIMPSGLEANRVLGPSPAAVVQANPAPQYYSAPVQNTLAQQLAALGPSPAAIVQANPAPEYYSAPQQVAPLGPSPAAFAQANPAPQYYSAPIQNTLAQQLAALGPSPAAINQVNPAPDYYSAPAPLGPSPTMITQANPAPEYYAVPAAPMQVAEAPITGTVPLPRPRPVALDPVTKALQIASNARPDLIGGRQNDERRGGRDGTSISKADMSALIAMGYTKEEIRKMTPEQIDKILRPENVAGVAPPATETPVTTPTEPVVTPTEPVAAARGGRIGYKEGGNTPVDSYYGPAQLPDLPAYIPSGGPPTYTMPAASPLVSGFVNSISPQQQMVAPQAAPPQSAAPNNSAPMPQQPETVVNPNAGQVIPSVPTPPKQPPATQPPATQPPSNGWMSWSDWHAQNPGGNWLEYWADMFRNRASGGAVNSSNNSIDNALRLARR